MPHPLLIFGKSDYLIQIVDINSHNKWQTVQIQIIWLLQKPTDLNLHCLQRQGISGFSRTRVKWNDVFELWRFKFSLTSTQWLQLSWEIAYTFKGGNFQSCIGYLLKGVSLKRKEFALLGSWFFPFGVDQFSEKTWWMGRSQKQEVTKIVSPLKMTENLVS